MIGSRTGLVAAGQKKYVKFLFICKIVTPNTKVSEIQLKIQLKILKRRLRFVLAADLSTSGLRVGGLFWTSFHQPGSPNSCAPDRKKAGLPTDRQPATVLHQVDVFFLCY